MKTLLSLLCGGLLIGSAISQRLFSWDALGGAVSEMQPPKVFPPIPMVGPSGDISIDKIFTLNGLCIRPRHVLAGGFACDTNDLGAVPFSAVMGPMGEGLAFMNHPAQGRRCQAARAVPACRWARPRSPPA
ncbi:MAG: hypothetical protein ACI89X_001839 [Planctomycetota bacterium]|jgi:hypothetical protein